jgi:hypothetical protein
MSQVITVRVNFQLSTETAERRLERVTTQVLYVERMLSRTLSLMRRLSGSESMDHAIMKAQQAIRVFNSLRLAAHAAQAATGPLGWALAALGVIGFLADTGELLYDSNQGG